MELEAQFLENARFETRRLKDLAEKAVTQVEDDSLLHHTLDAESNSIAVLMQHLGGNLLSRWTRFLETDGEKPDRHRDREFESNRALTRRDLLELWERGWSRCIESLDSLTPDDLSKTVRIRGEELSVPQAIQRQLVHTAYHVGQIVLLAKHLGSKHWTSLS
ncbi:MAG: DUF1572 family protein, partial [Vicinamibacteria bacterium]